MARRWRRGRNLAQSPTSGWCARGSARRNPVIQRTPMAGAALEYVQTTMVNSQGLHLAVYKWEVEDPKAIVYMAHGHLNHARFEYYTRSAIGEPRNQYKGSWVHALNESGYTVVSMDYQGHGCSDGVVEGMKGYFHRYDDLVKDFIELCGAPMLSLETIAKKGLNPILHPIATILSMIVPRARIVHQEQNDMFTYINDELWMDPYTVKEDYVPVRVAAEYLATCQVVVANLHKVSAATPLYRPGCTQRRAEARVP
eukprot:scaffold3443_cov404-Prasinococcus_capsulatus_cf.AAC.17